MTRAACVVLCCTSVLFLSFFQRHLALPFSPDTRGPASPCSLGASQAVSIRRERSCPSLPPVTSARAGRLADLRPPTSGRSLPLPPLRLSKKMWLDLQDKNKKGSTRVYSTPIYEIHPTDRGSDRLQFSPRPLVGCPCWVFSTSQAHNAPRPSSQAVRPPLPLHSTLAHVVFPMALRSWRPVLESA